MKNNPTKLRRAKNEKMISILLALSTAIVMCMPLCAEEPESGGIRNVFSDNDISCIQNLLLAWLSTDGPSENIDSVQVGDKIPAYEYVDSSLVTFDSASYYPVYSDHEILGVLGIHGNKSDPTYSFGSEWASQIDEYIKSNRSEFCIVVTENQLFFKTSDEAELIEEYRFAMPEVNAVADSPSAESILAAQNSDQTEYYSDREKYSLAIPPQTRAAYVANIKVGTYKQTRGECWAAATMLIGKFITKNNAYTPFAICDKMGIGYDAGGSDQDIVDALNTCYGVKGTLQGVLTPNQMEPHVSKQRPGCINWLEVNRRYGHSTAFCGYSSDSSASRYGIRISDSNTGAYKWLYKNGQPSQKLGFQYTYGGLTYNWKSTITT